MSLDGSDELADLSAGPVVPAEVAAAWIVPQMEACDGRPGRLSSFPASKQVKAETCMHAENARCNCAVAWDEVVTDAELLVHGEHVCMKGQALSTEHGDGGWVNSESDARYPSSHLNIHDSPCRKRSYAAAMHADKQPSAGDACDTCMHGECAMHRKHRSDEREGSGRIGRKAEVVAQLMVSATGHSDASAHAWPRLIAITLCAAPNHAVCAADADAVHAVQRTLCNVFATEAVPRNASNGMNTATVEGMGTDGAAAGKARAAPHSVSQHLPHMQTPFATLPPLSTNETIGRPETVQHESAGYCFAVAKGHAESPVDTLDVLGNSCHSEELFHHSSLCIASSMHGTVTVAAPSGSFITFSPFNSQREIHRKERAKTAQVAVHDLPSDNARLVNMRAPWPPAQVYVCASVHAHLPRLSCVQARVPGPGANGTVDSMNVLDRHVSTPNALVAGTKDGRILSVSTSAQLHLRDQVLIPSIVHALHACGASSIKVSSAMHSQMLLLAPPRPQSVPIEKDKSMHAQGTGSHSVMHTAHTNFQTFTDVYSTVFRSVAEHSSSQDLDFDASTAGTAGAAQHSAARLLPVSSGACLASCELLLVRTQWPEVATSPNAMHASHASPSPAENVFSTCRQGAQIDAASLFVCSNSLELTLYQSDYITSPSHMNIPADSAVAYTHVQDARSHTPEGSAGEGSLAAASVEYATPPGVSQHALWCPATGETVLSSSASAASTTAAAAVGAVGGVSPVVDGKADHMNVPESSVTAAAAAAAAAMVSQSVSKEGSMLAGGCAAAAALVATENASNASLVFWCVSTSGHLTADGTPETNGAVNEAELEAMHDIHASAEGEQRVLGSGVGAPRCGATHVQHAYLADAIGGDRQVCESSDACASEDSYR